jgi:hypothetical protein
MKKTILTFTMIFLFGFTAFASNADLFKLDYNAVQQEFTELNVVVDLVQANPDLTYDALLLTHSGLVESINLMPNAAIPMPGGGPVLGIPSFWWGCAFGVVGVGIVYFLSDQDTGQAKKALLGCVVSSVVGGVLYFVGVAAAITGG